MFTIKVLSKAQKQCFVGVFEITLKWELIDKAEGAAVDISEK